MTRPLWALLEQALRATNEILLTEQESPGTASDRTILLQVLRNQQLSLRCYIEALEVWVTPVPPTPVTISENAALAQTLLQKMRKKKEGG